MPASPLRAAVTPSTHDRHWLVKSEPDVFSFADLEASPDRRTLWTGVRNYQARNLLRDAMQPGDPVLFYHSNASPPGVMGLARVARVGLADPTQFDPADPYFDAASRREAPRWYAPEIEAIAPLPRFVSLAELKTCPALAGMGLLQRGARLSVLPVSPAEWDAILDLAHRAA